jgi:glycosyltransferase involved in cell wall biosynthesis
MHHDVPVVAYGAGAIPETLGTGGLCLPSKEPTKVAAAVHRVLDDAGLRDALVAAGRSQLAGFGLDRTRERMADALRALVGA